MIIRPCEAKDVAQICEIYNFYVTNTTITFEELPISVEDMSKRIDTYTQLYPWLVCEEAGEIKGYAYASKWKERAAYKNTAEMTVYLKKGCARKGYGKALYKHLLDVLAQKNCHVILGCIALPNEASIGLHEYFGFKKVAHFTEVGRKFGTWIDVGYWEKVTRENS